MINYMNKVAEMLGLELGETFRIEGSDRGKEQYFQFTKKGIRVSMDGIHWMKGTSTTVLEDIVAGRVKVAALSWKPKKGEIYYIPNINNTVNCDYFCWEEDSVDIKYYNLGLVCKTKEIAIELAQRMLAVAKEEKEK